MNKQLHWKRLALWLVSKTQMTWCSTFSVYFLFTGALIVTSRLSSSTTSNSTWVSIVRRKMGSRGLSSVGSATNSSTPRKHWRTTSKSTVMWVNFKNIFYFGNFPWKLHKHEKIGANEGSAPLDPPMKNDATFFLVGGGDEFSSWWKIELA